MKIGTLAIRGVIGPLFVGHGTQKLFGWFGGHGIEGTGASFEQLGLRPGKRHAAAAGMAETVGGALLTIGFLTPLAASLVTGTMVTAIRKVHAKNGPWASQGGFEYNLALIAAMLIVTDDGPGIPSVDAVLFPELKGPKLALLQLGAAVAGSFIGSAPPLNASEHTPAEGEADAAGDPASNGSGTVAPVSTQT
jgi:putative oxidoreductase